MISDVSTQGIYFGYISFAVCGLADKTLAPGAGLRTDAPFRNLRNRAQFPRWAAISRTPDARPGFPRKPYVAGVVTSRCRRRRSVRPGRLFCALAELAVQFLEEARPGRVRAGGCAGERARRPAQPTDLRGRAGAYVGAARSAHCPSGDPRRKM